MTTELLAKRHGVNDKVIGAFGENIIFQSRKMDISTVNSKHNSVHFTEVSRKLHFKRKCFHFSTALNTIYQN